MSRLFDRILGEGFGCHERAGGELVQRISSSLSNAIVLSIDNVAEYYRSQLKHGHYWTWKGGDFPNVAPPWQSFFIEFTPYRTGEREGILFNATDMRSNGAVFFGPNGAIDDARWLVSAWPFTHLADTGNTPIVTMEMMFVIGEDGQRIESTDRGAFQTKVWEWDTKDPQEEETARAAIITYQGALLFPCFLAISFLHCKNVVTVLNEPRLNRAARRRKEKPLVKYYTLEIEPMKQILRTEGGIEQVGLKKALHICRGHFKDYRERGLFGKKKGIFWWDHHVRGHLSEGAVVKDYAVKVP